MKLWFYIAKFGDYQDKFISLWTYGKYSHVELYFEEHDICFSASLRDKGVRFKKIEHSDHWDSVPLVSKYQEAEIIQWCETQVGLPYDLLGILGLGMNLPFVNNNAFMLHKKWYCSEIIATVLTAYNIKRLPAHISPNRLFKEVQ